MPSRTDGSQPRNGYFFAEGGQAEPIGPIQIPDGYKPDTADRFYRPADVQRTYMVDTEKKLIPQDNNGNLDKEHYHFIGRGKFADLMAALLDFKKVDPDYPGKTPKRVIVKRYDLKKLKETIDGFTRLRREIQISRVHSHENIVKFYEIFEEAPSPAVGVEYLWLVSERMDHTLEKYYDHLDMKRREKQAPKVDLRHLAALLVQILRALDYLHQRGIMHRDVTSRTVGLNQEGFTIKLLDFGLCREINPNLDHSTNVETLHIYKPIEVLMKSRYNMKVDIWATALVAIEMLGKRLFMPTGDESEIAQKIRRRGVENAIKDRIFAVLGVPEDRYGSVFGRSVSEIACPGQLDQILLDLKNKWIDKDIGPLKGNEFIDLIKRMLDPNMRTRPSADECLKHVFLRILNDKYERKSMHMQPSDDASMRARNEKDGRVLFAELKAGHTRLCFDVEPDPAEQDQQAENAHTATA